MSPSPTQARILRLLADRGMQTAATLATGVGGARVNEPAYGSAIFSPDEKYRYTLERDFWGENQRAIFLMLNPSTATADLDDPTIRRCIGFAHSWSCAGLLVLNLFAYRATDPRELRRVLDPIGPENERHIKERCAGRVVVCAWGTHGAFLHQNERVLGWLDEVGATVSTLKLTAAGHPSHPLYLPKISRPHEWKREVRV